MKRNIVPLLGIAFVVAIVSTGVFYGLFAGKMRSAPTDGQGQPIVVAARNLERGTVVKPDDLRLAQLKGKLTGSYGKVEEAVGVTVIDAMQQDEPVLRTHVATRDSNGAGDAGIRTGMRALSIRVSESSSILSLIHPGSRVDLQAVLERNGTAEIRTILENVQVLGLNPQVDPGGGNRSAAPVVTVLARPQDIDVVALADSSARIRVALRNPLDEATTPRRAVGLASVFSGAGSASQTAQSATIEKKTVAQPASGNLQGSWDHPIQLHVQALGASTAAISELVSKLEGPNADDSIRVAAFRPDTDAGEIVRRLVEKQELEVVSAWWLMAGLGRPISFRAGAAPYLLRVQFAPEAEAGGKLSLRVRPEITLQRGEGSETRKYDADLPDGSSFLVRGLLANQNDRRYLDRLFPGHSWIGRELVIFVTPHARKLSASAIAQSGRGQ